jgi:glycosyltransferase involved in cell wall biosynthesis
MLTICIPTYNYNIASLVDELIRQAGNSLIDIEIVVVDDCSTNKLIKQENRAIINCNAVTLIELDRNIGRAAVRNLLADKAKSDRLLFLDCDTFPVNGQFIKKYLTEIENEVVIGGIAYRPTLENPENTLRWHYGHARESRNANERMKNPYASFMTGNFMVSKAVLTSLKFDENIAGYGHEDTLFGILLKKKLVTVFHIDNPVYHDGLEPNAIFIEKTRNAISNLCSIIKNIKIAKEVIMHVTLAKWFYMIKKVGMKPVFSFLFSLTENLLLKLINNKKPNLKAFDLYKLGYMCKIF